MNDPGSDGSPEIPATHPDDQGAPTRGEPLAQPMRPPDAINPYLVGPVRRRRRSDWPVLVFALVVSGLIMAGCCIAGFALYVNNGGSFK